MGWIADLRIEPRKAAPCARRGGRPADARRRQDRARRARPAAARCARTEGHTWPRTRRRERKLVAGPFCAAHDLRARAQRHRGRVARRSPRCDRGVAVPESAARECGAYRENPYRRVDARANELADRALRHARHLVGPDGRALQPRLWPDRQRRPSLGNAGVGDRSLHRALCDDRGVYRGLPHALVAAGRLLVPPRLG